MCTCLLQENKWKKYRTFLLKTANGTERVEFGMLVSFTTLSAENLSVGNAGDVSNFSRGHDSLESRDTSQLTTEKVIFLGEIK